MSKLAKLAGLDPVENIRNVPSSSLGGGTKMALWANWQSRLIQTQEFSRFESE